MGGSEWAGNGLIQNIQKTNKQSKEVVNMYECGSLWMCGYPEIHVGVSHDRQVVHGEHVHKRQV